MSSECPKCGRPMWWTLRREGGQTRSYYQCPECEEPLGPVQPQQQQEIPCRLAKSRRPHDEVLALSGAVGDSRFGSG